MPAGIRCGLDRSDDLDGDHEGALPDRPWWHAHALCSGTGTGAFFPGRGEMTSPQKLLCRSCPVRADCLAESVRHGERHGIWGGLTERERRVLRRRGMVRSSFGDVVRVDDDGAVSIEVDQDRPAPPADEALATYRQATSRRRWTA